MVRCPSCGEDVVLARRCPYCGAEVPQPSLSGKDAAGKDHQDDRERETAVRGVFRGRLQEPDASAGESGSGFPRDGRETAGEEGRRPFGSQQGGGQAGRRVPGGWSGLGQLGRFLLNPRANPLRKAWVIGLLVAGALYALSPIDLIPDLPVIGWVDDAVVLGLLWRVIRNELPASDKT